MAAGLVAGGREELCVGAALRCRARSFAGRLVEDRSVDDAADPLDSADRFLSLLRYTNSNTLDLANDQLSYYYGDECSYNDGYS